MNPFTIRGRLTVAAKQQGMRLSEDLMSQIRTAARWTLNEAEDEISLVGTVAGWGWFWSAIGFGFDPLKALGRGKIWFKDGLRYRVSVLELFWTCLFEIGIWSPLAVWHLAEVGESGFAMLWPIPAALILAGMYFLISRAFAHRKLRKALEEALLRTMAAYDKA